MPRARDFLERFRGAGAPGAAATTGVPADRVAELSAELGPVLDLLADTQAEARTIRAEALREAERRRSAGAERARTVVATARRQAAAERAEAAAEVTGLAATESARLDADAQREAEAVRQCSVERLPAYVERAVAAAREALATREAPPPPRTP